MEVGYPKNWAIPGYAHDYLFLQYFNGLFFGWTLRPNLKSVALPILEIIAIAVFGGGCKNLQSKKRGSYGVGNGTVRKSDIL